MITVDEKKIPWRPGMTVAQVLERLDPDGLIAVVRLDGRLVSRPNFAATPVPDGSEMILLPMIAGG